MDWTEAWVGHRLTDADSASFPRGARVLDCGCGSGEQLRELAARGCRPIGADRDWSAVKKAAQAGFAGVVAESERLPFRSACFDGVISRVVLPYTDEARALAEMARILRPAGELELTVHGAGYYVAYLLCSRRFKRRIYSLRTLLNTWLYCASAHRRLVGDTLYQSLRRLRRYSRRSGLGLVRVSRSPEFLRWPVFVYLRLKRVTPDRPVTALGGLRVAAD
jgi:SAM-dependent methyltransferase